MISKAHHAEINKLSNINKTNKMRKNKKNPCFFSQNASIFLKKYRFDSDTWKYSGIEYPVSTSAQL